MKSLRDSVFVLAALSACALAGTEGGERHWAFEPVRQVSVPIDGSGWADGPVDRFILAKLTSERLQPAELTDRTTLVRRVFFDLLGLPPQPDEVDAFVADSSSDAWPKLVDRLLASPHYGERWGRHWMDVVRYADTAGDNADYPVPEARLYRDFIIDAFNSDKPFDAFVREQLAGDILARQAPQDREGYASKLAATGFLALSRRYGTGPYELWHLTLEDTIDTTGRAFLGLSLRCARCHDHKFDPVTMDDYYGLYGIFASTQFPWAGSEEVHSKQLDRMKFVPLASEAEAAARLAAYQAKIAEFEAQIKQLETSTDAAAKGRIESLRNELRSFRRRGLPDDLPGAYAVADGPVVETRVQLAGEPSQPGQIAPRCVPRYLAGEAAVTIPLGESGRLQFAQWLTRPEHPLTARVMVNRIWQHHFGRGLVSTASNFGESGEPPTHPELLDWLARRFVDESWSVKAIHREILLSKSYRLSSTAPEAAARLDPANRWYARFERRRLDAESIRDAQLAVAGRLDRSRPGEHPFPPIAQWTWTQHNPFKAVYASNHRSVYLMTQRIQRHPFLSLFDGPDPNISTDVRTSATVPLQALWAMNNEFVTEQAAAFARRLLDSDETPGPQDIVARVDLAHRLAYARGAKEEERQRAASFLTGYQDELVKAGTPPEAAELEAWTSYARVLLTANEFVYVD